MHMNDTKIAIQKKIIIYEDRNIPLSQRNLVLYQIGSFQRRGGLLDVATNNLKIFCSSIRTHYDASPQDAFYIFNTVGGKLNHLKPFLPLHHPNVANVDWNHAPDGSELHMKTLRLLGKAIVLSFNAIFFLSDEVRGPLLFRDNGQWIVEYRKLLDANNVGMVGATMSCENTPHVQSHFYAWRAELIPQLWDSSEHELNAAESLGNSDVVRAAGFNLSSMLYAKRYQQPYFNGQCALGCGSRMMPILNPVSWCNLQPEEVIFMQWGGSANAGGCSLAVDRMRDILATLADSMPALELIVPEVLTGGNLYELYKEYSEEVYKERIRPSPVAEIAVANEVQGEAPAVASMVCFAVRTASMHDSTEEVRSKSMFEDVDISGFIRSLLRQTNPLWMAYFFVTDTNPFDHRLRDIVAQYEDPRLVFTPIPSKYKIEFTKMDAGYTATDYVMGKLAHRQECTWLTATNADNIYGSDVVNRVLNAPLMPVSKKVPDILLNPIDSRNFEWADLVRRRDLTKGHGVEMTWTDYCTGLEATLLFNSYTYTIQPSPEVGKVDLASVFYKRTKYLEEGMSFSNFTNPSLYPCLGCQDGYLPQHLVKNAHWTYVRLSIDGLKSIIFHGPSPTWCIAEGNVWFDYPAVNKVGCISHATVRMLSYHNPKYYDWTHLNFNKEMKVCLRLSRQGFYSELEGGE